MSKPQNVDEAIKQWSSINLTKTLADLSSVGLEIENSKSKSLESRKRLAEDTRVFKKAEEGEKLQKVDDLLKGYQQEIDAILKRSKFAETSFLQLYQILYGAADPVDLLKHASAAPSGDSSALKEAQEKLRAAEMRAVRLETEMLDMEREFATVKNQEVTVRTLNEKLAEAEKAGEDRVQKEAAAKDEYWNRVLAQARNDAAAEASRYRAQLADAERQRTLLNAQIESADAKLAEVREQYEAKLAARAAEIETLSGEAERLAVELAEAQSQGERRGSGLAMQHSMNSSESLESSLHSLGASQARLAVMQQEGEALRARIVQLEESERTLDHRHTSELTSLHALLAKAEEERERLDEELKKRPSMAEYFELRQRLRNEEIVALCEVEGGSTDLERRLLVKQQQLEGTLSSFRVRCAEQEASLTQLSSANAALEDRLRDASTLCSQLEAHLVQLNAPSSSQLAVNALTQSSDSLRGSLIPFTISAPSPSSLVSGSQHTFGVLPSSPENSAVAVPSDTASVSSDAVAGAYSNSTMPSMMDMVAAQRDRLRQRVLELEQSRDQHRSLYERERQRTEQYHSDNIMLVEKVRYLQAYRPDRSSAAPSNLGIANGGARRKPGQVASDDVIDDVESRYGKVYEDNVVDPFTNFREQEKIRRVHNMSVGERTLVQLMSMLLGTRPTRIGLMVYLLSLHLLVFFALFLSTHTGAGRSKP